MEVSKVPKKYSKDKTHRINSAVSEEMYTKLLELKEQLGIPMSVLIRNFIAMGIRNHYDESKRFK